MNTNSFGLLEVGSCGPEGPYLVRQDTDYIFTRTVYGPSNLIWKLSRLEIGGRTKAVGSG